MSKQIKPSVKVGSIQRVYVNALAVSEHILELAPLSTRVPVEYISIIDVSSINFDMKTEDEQVHILDAYRAFLNSINFDIQIIVRILPLDIRPYLLKMHHFAENAKGSLLHNIAQDHIVFVMEMMKTRMLLERKFYIVITSRAALDDHPTALKRRPTSQISSEEIKNTLQARSDKILKELERVGLTGKLLANNELVQVYYQSWNIERGIRRPVTQEVLDSIAKPINKNQIYAQWLIEQERPTPSFENKFSPDLSDIIAPSKIELQRDHIMVDRAFIRTLAVTRYPRYVNSGWLERIVDMDEPMEISMHLHPQASSAAIRQLTRRLTELESTARMNRSQGRLADAENELGIGDIEQLRMKLQRGDEHFFASSMYICLRGKSLAVLNDRVTRITATLDSLQIKVRSCIYEQDLGLLSCIPEGRDRLFRTHPLDTSTITMAFPFISSSMSMQDGVLYGLAPNGSPIIIDTFSQELENANKVIFAKSGAGKSFGCKVEALRNLVRGIDTFIIDPEDEYKPIAQSVGGQVIYLSAGSANHINPFDISTDGDSNSDIIADKIQSLHVFFDLLLADRSPVGLVPLSQREKSLLDLAMSMMYAHAGITAEHSTHSNPMPLLKDLHEILVSGACGHDDTHLAERIARYTQGSNTIFSQPTNVRLDKSLIVFSIRDMDTEMRPVALFLIAEFIWGQIRNHERRPRQLLIDEAWTLMQFAEGGQFLAGLARRARKYFLSLVTITQDVQDFLTNEHGRTILANSSIKLLMKQDSTTIDAVVETFKLSTREKQYLLGCQKGQGLLFARQTHVGIKIEASPLEHRLATTDPHELAQLLRE